MGFNEKMSLESIVFKKRIEDELGNQIPKEPVRSAITGRIVLDQKTYNYLQVCFANGDYNKWCTGVDEGVDPSGDLSLLLFHYIKVGDAKKFNEIFTTEAEAEEEAKEAAAKENKSE